MRNNKFFLLLLLACSIRLSATSQSILQAEEKLKYISDLYTKGSIDKKAYLDSVHFWASKNFQDGNFFSKEKLSEHLGLYKTVAYSDTSFAKHQSNYFAYLANNAGLQGKPGECVYFLEKYDNQNLTGRKKKSFSALTIRFQRLKNINNYNKVIELYEKNISYLSSLPNLIKKDSILNDVVINSLFIFTGATRAYANLRDTSKLLQTIELVQEVKKNYLKKVPSTDIFAFVMTYHADALLFDKYFTLLKDMPRTREVLEKKRNLLYADTSVSNLRRQWSESDFLNTMIQYQIQVNNIDSVAIYLKKYKGLNYQSVNKELLNLYESKYFAAIGKYDSAYARAVLLSALKDTSQVQLTDELDGLLTAYVQAEKSKEELQLAEKAKQRRAIVILIISTIAALLITLIYAAMKRKERRAKADIEKLNNETNLQIAVLEESRHQAVKDEQERLGRNLHDGLASYLAAIKYQLEGLKMDITEGKTKAEIEKITQHANLAYQTVRSKSHELAMLSETGKEKTFQERINALVANTLPDSRYSKKVIVDEDVLQYADTPVKIELLRIIQEAITNIIKHAKAKTVEIILYIDNGKLNMNISDDGKGFDIIQAAKKQGLGLGSIKKRVATLKGELQINSGSKGTEIHVIMPAVM